MKNNKETHRILVVDDDPDLCTLLKGFLGRKGFAVETAGRKSQALDLVKKERFDLILCDHRLPDGDSLEMLDLFRTNAPGTPVIVITGYSDVRIAVDLMRRGAHDYVVKPLYPDDIALRIEEALDGKHGEVEQPKAGKTKVAAPKPATTRPFVHGTGAFAAKLKEHIALVAPTDLGVLITGETGTGKEYVAREIHRESPRSDKPFVALDCGALTGDLAASELFGHVKGSFTGALADKVGCFKQAHGGTLFLDEVGNLSHENQMKLLRVLQERVVRRVGDDRDIPVDVRIISATNEDLRPGSGNGSFREDLFHRLNEFGFELLPLRNRPEDIPHYAEHFLGLASERLGRSARAFAPDARDAMVAHGWPGNLRELNNVIKRAVLLSTGELITRKELPVEIGAGVSVLPAEGEGGLRDASHRAERQAILTALEQNGFNKTRTADMLNIDRKTLYNKLKSYGIEL